MNEVTSYQESPVFTDFYQAIFEQSLDAIFILDETGKIIQANPSACHQIGSALHHVITKNIKDFKDPAYKKVLDDQLLVAKKEGSVTFLSVHLYKNEIPIPVECQLRFFDHNGQTQILYTSRVSSPNQQCNFEYEKIIQATGDGYWMVDVKNARIIDANETFGKMLGYTREELLRMSISDLEVIESPEDTAEHIRKVMEEGHDVFETKHRHKEGHVIEFEVSVSFSDINGGVIFVFQRDITERKRQEEVQKLASLVINSSTASVMITDADNRIVSVNPAFTELTGYHSEEVVGKVPGFLASGRHTKNFFEDMWQTLSEVGHWEGEWWNRNRNGEEYVEQVNLSRLLDNEGNVFRYVKIATDVTEKRRLEEKIWYQASYDTVTGLPNRRLFLDRFSQELKKCDRTGDGLAILYLDLDNFKSVNDEYGHVAGDMLLIEASRRICSCVRSTDTVTRLGGDEFAVLLIDLNDTARVEAVADDIKETLAQSFRLHNIDVSISASIGIASYPKDATDMDDLIKKADLAMYAVKHGGKNHYSYWNNICTID